MVLNDRRGHHQHDTNDPPCGVDQRCTDSHAEHALACGHQRRADEHVRVPISLLIGTNISDADTGAIKGIAIDAASTTGGHWEFSLNGGANWALFPTVGATAALLLRDTDFVRFVPDTQNGSTPTFGYRAWDQTGATAGQHGTTANLSVIGTGGSTPFSANTDTVSIMVSSVNDAPDLAPDSPVLTSITEDDFGVVPSQTVASFIGATITDVDTGAATGIAISATTTTNGQWEYQLFGASTWTVFPAIGNASALLLDVVDSIRFVPNGIQGGASTLTYHAWDQTFGVSGATANLTTLGTGGDTAFSSATNTATLNVTSVNDAPELTPAAPTLNPITEDQTANSGQTVASFLAGVADADPAAATGIAIASTVDGNGHWDYSLDGLNWLPVDTGPAGFGLLLRASDFIRFVPNAQEATSASVTYYAWDQSSGTPGGTADVTTTRGGSTPFSIVSDTASIAVSAVNDAPDLVPASPVLATITEDDITNAGQTVADILGASVSDVDSVALEGIAVVSTVNGNGDWEYSVDGTVWVPFGAVTPGAALLLRPADFVRFVPDGQNATAASFDYRAWDQTSGTFGTPANVTVNGGASAYSGATDTASIDVTDLNDTPTAAADTGTTGENEITSFDVLANDIDVDAGDTKTLDPTLVVGGVTSGNTTVSGINASGAFAVVSNQIQFTPGTLFDALGAGQSANIVVNYTMRDGQNVSSGAALTLTVNGVNDAPVLDNVDDSAAYPPGSGPVILSPGLTIGDIDSPTLSGAIVRINSATTFLGDILAANGQTNGAVPGHPLINAVYNPGNATLLLTGVATLAEYEQVLRLVTFQSTSASPTNGGLNAARTVEWQVNDGTAQNNLSNLKTTDLRLHVLDLDSNNSSALVTEYAGTFTEDGAAVAIADTDVTITDPDSAIMKSATITITNVKAGDLLAVNGMLPPGITASAFNSSTGVLTLTSTSGSPSAGNYEEALHKIVFSNTSQSPDASPRIIEVVVKDSLDIVTNIATTTITVVSTNDAPVNAVPGAQSVNEDTNLVFSSGNGNAITIFDAELAAGSGTATVTLSVLHGKLTLGSTAGLSGVSGDGTGSVTFTSTQGAANAALGASLVYIGNLDFNGADTLTVVTSDRGNTGTGGTLTDTDTVSITVNAVPDAPVITSNGGGATAAISIAENSTAVTTVAATDGDTGTTLTYSLAGGADQALFLIDASTGALSFATAPNFEAPGDADHNNSYIVQVRASDGSLFDEQTITVRITDVARSPRPARRAMTASRRSPATNASMRSAASTPSRSDSAWSMRR